MRRLGPLVAALLVAACAPNGAAPATGSPSAAPAVAAVPLAGADQPWPAGLRLPGLRVVGDLPPAERRLVVALDGEGALFVDGVPSAFDAFTATLRQRAHTAEPAGASDLDVVFACDPELPWGVVARCLIACAEARVKRIWFAARHASSEDAGALAVFLPEDRGVMPARAAHPATTVRVRPGWPPSDPLGLHDPLRELIAAQPGLVVTLDADATTPLGLVLRLVEVAALEGAAGCSFTGRPLTPLGPDGLAGEVAALRKGERARQVSIGRVTLAGPSLLIPQPDLVRGAYAGFTTQVSGDEEEPVIEEEPATPGGR